MMLLQNVLDMVQPVARLCARLVVGFAVVNAMQVHRRVRQEEEPKADPNLRHKNRIEDDEEQQCRTHTRAAKVRLRRPPMQR